MTNLEYLYVKLKLFLYNLLIRHRQTSYRVTK